MKCVRCGHDSKYKERSNRKCPKCKGQFAFEPKTGDPLSDVAFQKAIDAVSSEGRLRWGVEHLYYEVARRYRKAKAVGVGGIVACAFIGLFLSVIGMIITRSELAFLILPTCVLLGVLAWWGDKNRTTVRPDLATFNKLWARWTVAHGTPPGLIVRPSKPPPARAMEADVGDYSFDRAVICDRARTVDLLLANRFHFENNCAILSADGYPQGPFETVRAMLRRNPRLQVFALHDATVEGCRLARRLSDDPAWFKGGVRVTDVGLRPRQAGPWKGLYLPSARRDAAGPGISPAEAQWLSEYSLELAAIRPEQVLKRLFRAINRQPEASTSDSSSGSGGGDGGSSTYVATSGNGDGGSAQDNDSFSTDANDTDAGADSFG